MLSTCSLPALFGNMSWHLKLQVLAHCCGTRVRRPHNNHSVSSAVLALLYTKPLQVLAAVSLLQAPATSACSYTNVLWRLSTAGSRELLWRACQTTTTLATLPHQRPTSARARSTASTWGRWCSQTGTCSSQHTRQVRPRCFCALHNALEQQNYHVMRPCVIWHWCSQIGTCFSQHTPQVS
jgi:hypothetical protein